MDEPVSYPLLTLDQLEDPSYFESSHFAFSQSSIPLSNSRKPTSQERRPRLLVCHDMMGGYQDDKWIQGSRNSEAYSLWHWHLIDIFVYFSHSLVTLPPPCWTNAAHKHGVQVLGTFITEWDNGKAVCNRLLASKEATDKYASLLAKLAERLRFDGWLINIENEVKREHLDNLLEFVKLLTNYMHERVPGSVVIWYDSVTKDGKLDWQDCLNDKNKCFFDVCDGIFTNYTWKADYPGQCAITAGPRRYDVYMGVDVFGRNTFGGGGFKSNVALKAAREAGVSAAIFAPGWVFQTKQGPSFPAAQNHWWGLVAECWPSAQHYPVELPFFSNFDQGFGKEMHIKGETVSRSPWSNISCQSLQPLLRIEAGSKEGHFESVVSIEESVYSGGACVKFSGEMEEQTYCLTVLYETDVIISSTPILFSYTVRRTGCSGFLLLLKVHDQKGITCILLLDPEEKDNQEICGNINSEIAFKFPSRAYQVEGNQDWCFREYNIDVIGKLEGIFAVSYFCKMKLDNIYDLCKFSDPANAKSGIAESEATGRLLYNALLGHISVSSDHDHGIFKKISLKCPMILWDESCGKSVVSLMLNWVIEGSKAAQLVQYHIYVSKRFDNNEALEHLGVAVVRAFYVSQLEVPKECKELCFYLQTFCACGISNSLENSQHIQVQVP